MFVTSGGELRQGAAELRVERRVAVTDITGTGSGRPPRGGPP